MRDLFNVGFNTLLVCRVFDINSHALVWYAAGHRLVSGGFAQAALPRRINYGLITPRCSTGIPAAGL